jgi:hypothetical protein
MSFEVRVFSVGRTEVPGPEVFWMAAWDEWHTLSFNVVLVRGHGHTILVNTGPPENLEPIDRVWRSRLGDRAAFVPAEALVRQLAGVGVRPDEVTHVVVTPFQLYSTGGIPLFRHAQICLSRRGWVHFHTTHGHPHDRRWSSFSPEVTTHLVTDAWDRVRLLEDEDEITAGVRTWWAGVHHRASVAVEVDSSDGVVVVSDAFFHFANLEQDRILGINESLEEAIACYARTRRVADHVVPLYEPKVFERYPDGIVAAEPADG